MSAAVLCTCTAFWTGSSAGSFQKIVETKNEDVWHLMNALGRLCSLFGMLRTLILAALVLLVVGLALGASGWMSAGTAAG
jgi:hypothetical protein